MDKQYDEILNVKEKVFNATLLVGTILGGLTFVLSLRNFYESDIKINYILNLVAIITFLIVYLFRGKISQRVKSEVVIVGLFILTFVDIYKLGAYSTTKILLVLIPFFSLIAFNLRRILTISIVALLFYVSFALLFTTGILEVTVDLNQRSTNMSSWLVNIVLISIAAYAVLIIVDLYNKAFYKLINRLEEQNVELQAHRNNLEELVAERSKELERANEELNATNDELNAINEELHQNKNIIETQNIELKTTLEHLQETQTKLVQSEKMASLGIMSAGVAHEINNPLNFIMGGYLGLENYFKNTDVPCDKDIPYFLSSIKVGVDRASEIVMALNQFSRNTESNSEPCDIHAIIDNCLIILSNQYDNQLEIVKDYSNKLPQLKGNSSKLHQVFFNILTNAIHATNAVGHIKISTKPFGSSALIEISDTGCGIKREYLDRVTDPFFTTKEPGKGTGLGLSIAYRIIQEHSGELKIDSVEQNGTTVTIKLPLIINNS